MILALTVPTLSVQNEFRTKMNTSSQGSLPASPDVAVLVGDLHASKKIDRDERARLQDRLRETLRALEELLRQDGLVPGAPAPLATRLALTGGDEFQGVFREPAAAVLVVREISERLHPHKVRFGLGRGPLATRLADHPAEMDGPAFHRARDALDRARARDALLAAEGFGDEVDDILSALFHLLGAQRERWTRRQLEYARALRQQVAAPSREGRPGTTSRPKGEPAAGGSPARPGSGAPTSPDLLLALAAPGRHVDPRSIFRGVQFRAARALGISPATLSRGLRAAGFFAITAAEHAALRLLAR